MSILDIAYSILIMPIQLVFETFFMLGYREIGNVGVSIIVLSLVMNFLVLPLYMRADKMQEHERDMEARLHDGVAHIRKTFKGDEKMMMLQTYYRQNGYKPTDVFKGSISLFLEIPFFIAAYAYLSHQPLLNDVPFGFIHNLGAPDGLLVIAGFHINVLPFVMTAINLVTCLLFTKGMPRKTKVQLYVMATLFLVLLYNSPAGLVFYWTLNNVFSLIKTLFYKLKDPKRVLAVMFAVAGVALIVFGAFFFDAPGLRKRALIIVLGLLLLLPLVVLLIGRKGHGFKSLQKLRGLPSSKKAYVASAVFLTAFFGLLIPSAVISSSPQEFFSLSQFMNPLWYVASALSISIGAFLLWMSVFYWLTSSKYKGLFQLAIWVICGISVIDYMFFGTNLGTLGSTLEYQNGLAFGRVDMLLNALVVIAVAIVFALFFAKFAKKVPAVLAVACVAIVGMAGFNVVTISQSVAQVDTLIAQYQESQPQFDLSTDKKNVVVIMLDRAMNEYIPFIFNEKPELVEEFSGFTYYDNVVSFGGFTNIASPALFGGYEYTPVEMNRRDDELLADKHNEALKVMPVLFAENGYDVTVLDPTYAGYQWIPDLSIYDEYEGIDAYITNGKYNEDVTYTDQIKANKRNFFYFGLMKATPLFAQAAFYDSGKYNRVASIEEYIIQWASDDGLTAGGTHKGFLDSYCVLENLDEMTKFDGDGEPGSFVLMTNDTTHGPMILQEPDYLPAESIDNRAYEAEHHDRFTLPDGSTLIVEDAEQYKHYQANVAALMSLGRWFEYLKANDAYDNTRIIIVSDHGRSTGSMMGVHELFYPLLLVKDFDATGFTTSSEFMTNGDVPTLAMEGLIQNPVNPFTGKLITNDEKYAHDQYVLHSYVWKTEENNGTTYLPDPWLSVHDDIHDMSNWSDVIDPLAQEN